MHADLRDSLANVADLRLIAAFADDRLGFPEENVLRVFFPDIHLITEKRRQEGKFKFASNYPDLLTAVAKEVKKLKSLKISPHILLEEALLLYFIKKEHN